MKNMIIAAVAVAMLACVGSVQAGEVSNDMLSDMGLSGMQSMSDAQGLEVRGMGGYARISTTLTVYSWPKIYELNRTVSAYGPRANVDTSTTIRVSTWLGSVFVHTSASASAGRPPS